MTISDRPWVVIRDGGSASPLVCCHPVGGRVDEYLGLARLLPEEQPIYGLQSRALADASLEHANIAAMAADYRHRLIHELGVGTFSVLGWSMGAMIAHSLAGELEQAGCEVSLVGMVDPRPASDWSPSFSIAVAMAVRIFSTTALSSRVRNLLRTLDRNRIEPADVLEWCADHGLVEKDSVDAVAFRAAIELFPRHIELQRSYGQGRCRAPIVLWRASGFAGGSDLDWSGATDSGVTISPLAATHYSIIKSPHIEQIARELTART